MAKEYHPGRRGQTMNRRIAKYAAFSTPVIAIGMAAGTASGYFIKPNSGHEVAGFFLFVIGSSVASVAILFNVMNILIGKTNPKEFARMFRKAAKPPQQLELPFLPQAAAHSISHASIARGLKSGR